jgi:hypothetical protein
MVAGLRGWQWLVSCLPLAIMGCRSVRHIPLCAIWAAPVLALLAQAASTVQGLGLLWRRLGMLAAGLAMVPALLTLVFLLRRPAPAVFTSGPVLGARSPYGVVAFLRTNGLSGRIYNPLWWGSYLTWELYPQVLVSMDGRNVTLFSRDAVAENLTFYLSADADPATPLRYAPDFLLLPADAPVLPRVRADTRWAVLYDDGDAVLLARAAGHAELVHRRDEGLLVRPSVTMPDVFR